MQVEASDVKDQVENELRQLLTVLPVDPLFEFIKG